MSLNGPVRPCSSPPSRWPGHKRVIYESGAWQQRDGITVVINTSRKKNCRLDRFRINLFARHKLARQSRQFHLTCYVQFGVSTKRGSCLTNLLLCFVRTVHSIRIRVISAPFRLFTRYFVLSEAMLFRSELDVFAFRLFHV